MNIDTSQITQLAGYLANPKKILDGSNINQIEENNSFVIDDDLENIIKTIDNKSDDAFAEKNAHFQKQNNAHLTNYEKMQSSKSEINQSPQQEQIQNQQQNQEFAKNQNKSIDLKQSDDQSFRNFPSIQQSFQKKPVEKNNLPKSEKSIVDEKFTESQIKLKKLEMLKKLSILVQQGIQLSQNYNMNSDLDIMEQEYALQLKLSKRQQSIQFLQNMTTNMAMGIEIMNEKFDPFGINLKGWSQVLSQDIDNYQEVFGELHDKYFTNVSCPPELKFVSMITISAIKFHLINSKLGAIPDLQKQIQQLKTKSQINPEMQKKTNNEINNLKLLKQHEQQFNSQQNVLQPPKLPDKIKNIIEESQSNASTDNYNLDEISISTINRTKKQKKIKQQKKMGNN